MRLLKEELHAAKTQHGDSMDLRTALVLSVSLHVMFVVPLTVYFLPAKSAPQSDRRIEVYYFRAADEIAAPETVIAATKKKPAAQQPPSAEQAPSKEEGPRAKGSPREEVAVARKESPAASGNEQWITQKDGINYFQLIREKIRSAVKKRYRGYSRNGDVRVYFTVERDGRLSQFSVDRAGSTTDATLLSIAQAGIKESSPFPPLPQSVKRGKFTFNLTITFKEQ